MEPKPIIEPEVSKNVREQAVINGIACALVAATGISIVIATRLAHKHFREAKEQAKLITKPKE